MRNVIPMRDLVASPPKAEKHAAGRLDSPLAALYSHRTSMAERTIGIALLGCGVVGGGVVRILTEQRDLIARRTGLIFDVRHVVVRDAGKARAAAGNLPLH